MSRKKLKEVKTEKPEPQPGQPEVKAEKPLTPREQKAIFIIAQDFEKSKKSGQQIRPIRAKYVDDFDITAVYRVLKGKGIDISTTYSFDFQANAHVFQLQLLLEGRKDQKRTRTTPLGDSESSRSGGWADLEDFFGGFFKGLK